MNVPNGPCKLGPGIANFDRFGMKIVVVVPAMPTIAGKLPENGDF